jgi:hypothetical protein
MRWSMNRAMAFRRGSATLDLSRDNLPRGEQGPKVPDGGFGVWQDGPRFFSAA